MPTKKITVSIPKLCEVNLDEMQTVANGKFCTHCCKTVWDFRNWSEEELGHFFANSEQLVCGRFAAVQLDTPLPVPSQNHYGKIAAAVLGFSLFLAQDAMAQPKAPLKPKQNMVAQQKIKSQKLIGHLQDENGNAAASLPVKLFEGSNLVNQVFSDSTGCFEIDIPQNLLHNQNVQLMIQSERYFPYQKSLADINWQASNSITIMLALNIIRVMPRVEHTAGLPVRYIGDLCAPVIKIEKDLKVSPNKKYNTKEIEQRGVENILKDVH